MTQLPPPSGQVRTRLVALALVAGAQGHVARRDAEQSTDLCRHDGLPCFVGRDTEDAHWRCGTSACREPVSQAPPADLPRPTLPRSVAADVERIRQAELRRARRALRQAKGIQHG